MSRLVLVLLLACGPELPAPACGDGFAQCGVNACMPDHGATCCDTTKGGFCGAAAKCCSFGCCPKDAFCDVLNHLCRGGS